MRELVDSGEDNRVDERHRHLLSARREGDEDTGCQNEKQRGDVEGHKPVHFYILDLDIFYKPPKLWSTTRHQKMSGRRAAKSKAVVAAETPAEAAPPVPVRKSKKPVKIVAVVSSSGIEGSFSAEPRRPLIAHLQIHSSDVQFSDMPIQYNPAPPLQPEPYDAGADNVFFSHQEPLVLVEEKVVAETPSVQVAPVVSPVVAEAAPMPAFVRTDLMIQFKADSEAHQLPAKSDIHCFWCIHAFDNQPCIIPEREEKGTWRVYGNFCCPECAVSYLLNETMDPHVRWERMALLHRLYDPDGISRIFPSPARESLRVFGGPMTIESFRSTVRAKKVRVDIHMPPMVSILGSIDTKPIDFFDSSLKNTMFSPEKTSVRSGGGGGGGEEGLRLKRTKPLKDRDSTLDAVMNIQIKAKR